MLRLAFSFFVLALLAYALGAYGIAGLSIEIGKILLFIFLGLAIFSFIASILRGKK